MKNEGDYSTNALHEMTELELKRRFKEGTNSKYWTPEDCQKELERRASINTARAMNRWTAVITVATVVNVIAAILQALAAVGWLKP
jgi:hypothetical protein